MLRFRRSEPVTPMELDVVVIGSGPGGYKAALTAAQQGARVALVEKGLAGGVCLNEGCVPKAALIRLAGLMESANSLNGRGLVGEVRGDFSAAMAHKARVVDGISANFPVWLRRLGIRYLQGSARLLDPRTVAVEGPGGNVTLQARRIIVATGAIPREHPACPADGVRILNSHHFMYQLDTLPDSVLVVGGGAVGCELGYFLQQFGSRVTLVERQDHLLGGMALPARATQLLERKFLRLGTELRLGVEVVGSRVGDDGVSVSFSDGGEGHYERVLVVIGRRPAPSGLGLERLGVELDTEGFIRTSKYLETTQPGIYAVGDCKPGPMSANAAFHDAKVAAFNAIRGNTLRANYHRVPLVIDSALQIATVGLLEERAEAAGFEPEFARANFMASIKARAHNDAEGFIEVVHDDETGQLLGGCIVGPDAGEQIHMLAAACQSDRGLWFFSDINYTHPSWYEDLGNAINPHAQAIARSGRDIFRPGIFATDVGGED